MDRKEDRPSRFIFPSGTSKVQAQAQAHPHAQDPASPVTSVVSPPHRLNNSSKDGYDVSDEPDTGLTRGLRYETHRPRTPPKQVSRIGPLAGDSRTTAAKRELSAVAASAALHGKGVRAPRNRGALADLFPDQFADRGNHESGRGPDEQDIRSNSTATDTFETSPDDAVRGASHELAWTAPRDGRDGLVDQMLNTFDQLDDSFAGNSSHAPPIFYADPDKYHLGSESRSRRPRGHTYSSSTSSGIPSQPHEALSGRGAHSRNKSSVGNFTTGLERVDSIRLVTDRRPSTQGAGRARRLSKSSIASGHEDATPTTLLGAPSRKQRQQVRRSASFDQSIIRSVLASSTTVLRDPLTMNEYDDLNAAPEPSVRPGPRRFGESNNTFSSVGSQAVRGRENNRDGGRTLTGLRRHGVSPQRIDSLQSDEPRNSSAAGYRDAPPISSSRLPPAPSSYQATAFSTNVPAGKEKEKGGFFKRMFGGGSKTSSTQSLAAAATAQSSMSTDNVALQRQQSTEQIATGRGRQTKTQPSEERQQSVSSRHHVPIPPTPEAMVPPTPRSKSESKEAPTLTKKSSFFRRRKKSVASAAPAVPKLPDSSTWYNGPHRDHSPASSLRNVMTPYLSSRPGTRVGQPGSKDDRTEDGRPPISPIMTDFQGQSGSREETTGGTLAAPRTSDSKPRRSTSKGQTRPNIKRGAHGDSSSSKPTAYEIARNDPDASELSDADFISAKSHVNSPVDEQAPEMFRPPAPTAAPPKVPAGDSASRDAKARHDLDPGTTPTHPPASVAMPTRSESETVQPAEEDYETGYRLFRFNSEPPTDDPSLPTNESDICAWLGEAGPERARVRKAYMELFDWKDTSILTALRKFCEHTRLAGETQQVDRVLEGIARRWTECNPSHGFKIVDVVHAICYSLILLNTDLHLADIEKRMTKAQFVKNTLRTCLKNIDDTDPDAFKGMETVKAKRVSRLIPGLAHPLDLSKVETSKSTGNLEVPRSPHSPTLPAAPASESGTVKLTIRRNSNEFQKNKFRLSARPSDNYALENLLGNVPPKDENEAPPPKTAAPPPDAQDDCGPLVKQPFLGGRAAWEAQVEAVLKSFYTSVQKQRLPLQDSNDRSRAPSSIGQTTGGATSVRRTPSIASRQSDGRGRNLESRGTVGGTASSRWTSRHRGNKPRLYAASNISLDDEMSMSGMSPSTSSLWSKHSFGRTQTSMSVQSFGSEAPGHEAYQQSIGFANALSQAIIREEGGSGAGDESDGEALKAAPLLDDESLELYGAPWAKEGTVKHKHHLEAVDKKAKERAWTECFAVIEKGWLRLFRFNSAKSASLRSKTLRAAVSGVGSSSRSLKSGSSGQKLVVGGGNWMDNALPLGRFLLRQTIASPLPPPGYSKSRPHVWALSLPNGAVHLFQAGTPEIVREYVTCANYWSARLSKEPLTGGVSSLEYGWSESLLGDLIASSQPNGSRASSRDGPGQQAPQSSLAEVFGSKRQRSTSNSSATTQVPNIPPRTGSRSFARPPSAMHSSRPSLQTSIRSSFETTASAVGAVRPRLAGDHVKIADWTPPPQSMMASALLEVDQLRVLSDYVANVKKELEKHNQLRPAIAQAYNPRHPNYARAMANFEKKSAYLLREIVKFTTYIESLQNAQVKRDEVNREREQRKRDLADMKVETAEELRRELSKSDLRKAAQYSAYDDDDDDVPEVPEVPKALMNLIT